jgi:hypothetical protein
MPGVMQPGRLSQAQTAQTHNLILGGLKMLEMKAGQKYLVEVQGWIMCKGVDSGKYRIELSDYKGSLTATFYKPKGKKPIARHYLHNIMIDNTDRNLNRTEIIKQLTWQEV